MLVEQMVDLKDLEKVEKMVERKVGLMVDVKAFLRAA